MAGAIAKYHCNYCEEDISSIRVKCSECNDFDLCLQCFSCGAEIGSHRSKHAYQLIDCGTFPLFNASNSDAWKAIEEVALLEAVEQYGFGNWEDIADSVGIKDLTGQDVKDHYCNFYVMGNIGQLTWSCVDKAFAIKDHTCPNDGPLSPSLMLPLPEISEISQQEQQELGYMPKRDDFEREFDNEAESLVSTLAVNAGDDDDLETALKLAHINMYQRRLKERFRKKNVAREYYLVNRFFQSHTNQQNQSQSSPQKNASVVKKKGFKDHEEHLTIEDKFKPFCQFDTLAEHKELFNNLKKEKELKSRIKELMRYRRNGLKKLSECSAFDAARNRREKRKENKKKSISSTNTGSVHKRLLSSMVKGTCEKEINSPTHIGRKGVGGERDLESSRKSDAKDFDITSLPGCRLLSEREKKLCTSVRLRPTQYVTLKTLILKDHGQTKKSATNKSSLENVDKTLRKKVVNFMVKSGWITS